MALVNIANMVVLDNPAPFQNPFQFEITFECLQELQEDLEWKVVYVGSAENSDHDQMLDEILVGPVPIGINKFILQADAPNVVGIPSKDLLGVTVVLVTCSYREKEFVRVGYYVNNEYIDPNYDPENDAPPPSPLDMTKVVRTILADKPRVTRFPISWNGEEEPTPQPQPDDTIDEDDVIQDDDMDDDDEEEEEDNDDMEDENESDKLMTIQMEDNNNSIPQDNIMVSNE